MAKRAFDIILSAIGLVLFSPIFLILSLLVKLSDGGPVLFRQDRVGQGGETFSILKFRSMVANAERLGPGITKDGDPRITRFGRFLRKTKLDELPQLWNVLRGEMSFVGPRPELPVYVGKYTAEQRKVLAMKPGITDLASLEFRDEEELLSNVAKGGSVSGNSAKSNSGVVEEFYVQNCIPRKIQLNLAYASKAGVWEDAKLIIRTVWVLGVKRKAPDATHPGILQRVPGFESRR